MQNLLNNGIAYYCYYIYCLNETHKFKNRNEINTLTYDMLLSDTIETEHKNTYHQAD